MKSVFYREELQPDTVRVSIYTYFRLITLHWTRCKQGAICLKTARVNFISFVLEKQNGLQLLYFLSSKFFALGREKIVLYNFFHNTSSSLMHLPLVTSQTRTWKNGISKFFASLQARQISTSVNFEFLETPRQFIYDWKFDTTQIY